jgi:hypothetical protein
VVDVQTLLEACFIDETFFLVKSKTSSFGTTLLKCWIISIFELQDIGLKEFYCILIL